MDQILRLRRSERNQQDFVKITNDHANKFLDIFAKHVLIIEIDDQLKNLVKIFRLFNFNFDLYYSQTNLLKIVYATSFKICKQTLRYRLRNDKLVLPLYKELMKYRRKYEKFRNVLWSFSSWTKYLPLEILNYIDQYL